MKKNSFGRIINIISTSVKEPIPNLGLSNTTRGAVASWSKTLSKEVGKYGVTVNNILPNSVNTSRLRNLFKTISKNENTSYLNIKKKWIQDIPVGRIAEPEEIAPTALLLASEEGSFYCGATLSPNGGEVMV